MKRDEIGLPQSPAQAAELHRLLEAVCGILFGAETEAEYRALEIAAMPFIDMQKGEPLGFSEEAAGTIAATRLAAEEMRERAAEAARQCFYDPQAEADPDYIAAAIRSLPLPPSSSPEDQEKAKAAATPTIADPDGEARS